jgi:hypothetical protein
MINQGTIIADQATALTIDPSALGFTNQGTLQATGAGGLTLTAGTFTNTGFTIEAQTGSRLTIATGGAATTITGGTLSTSGTGLIDVNTGTLLQGVTIASTVQQDNNQFVRIQNGLTNHGTWNMDAAGNLTRLTFEGAQTLGGTGSLVLSNSPNNQIHTDGTTLTQGAGHTIRGAGRLLENSGGMINQGTIIADQATALTIDPSALGFTNQGTLRAEATRTLTVTDGLSNFSAGTLTGGTYDVIGTMRLVGANITTNAAKIILDGVGSQLLSVASPGTTNALAGFATNAAAGDFTIKNGRNFTREGDFTNAGMMTIGALSTFTVDGLPANDYIQTGGSTRVDGTLIATDDVLINAGLLFGTGTIQADEVVLAGMLAPGTSPGTLTITGKYLQQAAGTLNVEIGGLLAGTQFDVVNISGMATLDGVLDIDLFGGFMPTLGQTFQIMTFGSRFGTSTFTTIINPAGFVFTPIYSNMNVILEVTAAPAVPEPGTLLLLASGGLAWLGYRRVTRRKPSAGSHQPSALEGAQVADVNG